MVHDGTRSGGDRCRVIGRIVVVNINRGLGQGGAKVPHHLGDGGGLVVAGDEDGNAKAAESGGSKSTQRI